MSNDPAATPGAHNEWSFEAIQARIAEERRQRIQRRCASKSNLPVRPNLAFYKQLAKARHKATLESDSTATLDRAQMEVAREHEYPSWQKFARAIRERNARATALEQAFSRGDQPTVARIVRDDRDAVLDVGSVASETTLAAIVKAIPGTAEAEEFLTALLNVVALHHASAGIEQCVELLVQSGAVDPDSANAALQGRIDRMGDASSRDAYALDRAMGIILTYLDYPEIEHMSDWDD